jgi:hypothetical protein
MYVCYHSWGCGCTQGSPCTLQSVNAHLLLIDLLSCALVGRFQICPVCPQSGPADQSRRGISCFRLGMSSRCGLSCSCSYSGMSSGEAGQARDSAGGGAVEDAATSFTPESATAAGRRSVPLCFSHFRSPCGNISNFGAP